jgi:hypothetical protein
VAAEADAAAVWIAPTRGAYRRHPHDEPAEPLTDDDIPF